MGKIYKKKTATNGVVQYREVTENKVVAKKDLDEALLARLESVAEGTEVPESADITPNAGEELHIAEGTSTRQITLSRPLLVNGIVFKGGKKITVPEDQAEDLLRIDREHGEYEASLIKSHDSTRTAAAARPQDVQ